MGVYTTREVLKMFSFKRGMLRRYIANGWITRPKATEKRSIATYNEDQIKRMLVVKTLEGAGFKACGVRRILELMAGQLDDIDSCNILDRCALIVNSEVRFTAIGKRSHVTIFIVPSNSLYQRADLLPYSARLQARYLCYLHFR